MKYAIIGFGKMGQAIANAFARKGIEVAVATTHDPESFASTAAAIGPTVIPKKLVEALEADIIFLAVRFEAHRSVAKSLPSWRGKTIVDMTNAYGISPEELGGQPSSKVVEKAFSGGKLVKGFNHLIANVFSSPPAHDGKRVVFLASDDVDAAEEVSVIAEDLGFSPIRLGKLSEGGLLIHAVGNIWGQLIFKDLIKFD